MGDGSRYYTVHRPTAHEGIGRALRNVYRQPAEDTIPPEMIDLLNLLDGARH